MEKHQWRPVSSQSSTKPSPRWGHSSCVIGSELILFGGYAQSIYMNDLWSYNTDTMQWTQIKTSGTIPAQRSNSSLHYDHVNKKIIMFGGGGANKTRFSSIMVLDWQTKVWSQIVNNQNQQCPWERTYHSSELLYPYLVVFGGEGVADLDDLWVYNLEDNKWKEVPIEQNGEKPCGRRFHSSCLIGNVFYVIAGCYSKYRPLSDVFSMDLSSLVASGSVLGLQWKEMQMKGASFLTRWGHACASLQNKIFIFGGRFSNDLNDVLVLDVETRKMRTLKTSPDNLPKPRRRACINFIGNCMVMFGGFNSDYFNDLHYINVSQGMARPKKYSVNWENVKQIVNQEENSDVVFETLSQEKVFAHKAILMQNFSSEEKYNEFFTKINKNQSKKTLIEILRFLYQGFGKTSLFQKYQLAFPRSEQQKQANILKQIQSIIDEDTSHQDIFSKKSLKITNNNIIELSDEHFGQFLQKNRQKSAQDVEIIVNHQYVLRSSWALLSSQSSFFKNALSNKYKCTKNSIQLWIPNGNIVLLEIVLNFLMLGLLVIPQKMTYQSWIQLYEIADYLGFTELKNISVFSIWTKIDDTSVDGILKFGTKEHLTDLCVSCARLKLKNIEEELNGFSNKHIENAYMQNKFQIKQKMIIKQASLAFKKKNSSLSTQGQKQNYETYNE